MPNKKPQQQRRNNGSQAMTVNVNNPVVVTTFANLGSPQTMDFTCSPAAITAASMSTVWVTRACILSMLLSSGTAAQTVSAPVHSAVKITGITLSMPGTNLAAASVPVSWNIQWFSDTGDNAEKSYSNPSTNLAKKYVPVPRGSRASKPSRALQPNALAIEGVGAIIALNEILFGISCNATTGEDLTITLHYRATVGLGSPAIITSTASGLIGNYWNALDCIAPNSSGAAGTLPTMTIGTWLLTPSKLMAYQAVIAKPAAFARTGG